MYWMGSSFVLDERAICTLWPAPLPTSLKGPLQRTIFLLFAVAHASLSCPSSSAGARHDTEKEAVSKVTDTASLPFHIESYSTNVNIPVLVRLQQFVNYFWLDSVITLSDLHNLFCSISLDRTSFNAASTLVPLRENPILLAAINVNPSSGMLRFCVTISFITISSSIDGMSSMDLLLYVSMFGRYTSHSLRKCLFSHIT